MVVVVVMMMICCGDDSDADICVTGCVGCGTLLIQYFTAAQ